MDSSKGTPFRRRRSTTRKKSRRRSSRLSSRISRGKSRGTSHRRSHRVSNLIQPSQKPPLVLPQTTDGLKMSIVGPHFWNEYISLGLNVPGLSPFNESRSSTSIHPNMLTFFFRDSFRSCGPCVHCTSSHQQFVRRPE